MGFLNMEKKKLKVYTLDQVKDEMIGTRGTPERESYEHELQVEILGEMIRMAREKQDLTQEELGNRIGVQKAQISKLERNTNNVTIATILRVFNALNVKVTFKIEMPNSKSQLV
jgi:ribosome-binding protein aMBF1 (putative translation factor)